MMALEIEERSKFCWAARMASLPFRALDPLMMRWSRR